MNKKKKKKDKTQKEMQERDRRRDEQETNMKTSNHITHTTKELNQQHRDGDWKYGGCG